MNLPSRHCRRALMLAVMLACGSTQAAVPEESTPAAGPATPTPDESAFFPGAAQMGMSEVRAAAIAARRATNADTRAFASTMSTDHAASNAQLALLAQRRGASLPAQLDQDHQTLLDLLESVDVKTFDAVYARRMVRAHQDAIDLYAGTVSKVTDVEVQAFARDSLPVLKHHLEMAQQLKAN